MLLLLRLHCLLRRHGERLDPVLLRLQVQRQCRRHVHRLRLFELRKRRRHVHRLRMLELRKRRRNACRLRMQLRLPPLRKLIRSA